jgi:hypothetical protein
VNLGSGPRQAIAAIADFTLRRLRGYAKYAVSGCYRGDTVGPRICNKLGAKVVYCLGAALK